MFSGPSTIDALGRLSQITDATGTTTYLYDVGDNLTWVTQGTQLLTSCVDPQGVTHSRCFAYDSLSRLSSAKNPESGTTAYAYDANGNLTSKNDARSTVSTLLYDPLSRVIQKSYSDGTTTTASSCYDGKTTATSYTGTLVTCTGAQALSNANAVGRLTWVGKGNSATSFSLFDGLGRVLNHAQTTAGISYPFSYTYNAAGGTTTETYPSGRVVTATYDGAGRPNGITGIKGTTSATYASSIAYAPQSAVQQINRGDSLFETTGYNSRLRPLSISLGPSAGSATVAQFNLSYCGTTCNNDNGSVWSQTTLPLNVTNTYTYDGANRITAAAEGTVWSQNYVYDVYGNRAVLTGTGAYIPNPGFTPQVPSLTSTLPYTNNQWNGATHDGVGNVWKLNGFTYTYDADNRQTQTVQVVGSNNITSTYSYDGEGRRVTRVTGGVTTVYAYDAMGALAAEYTDAVAPPPSPCPVPTCYLTADHLGSTRVMTTSTGGVVARHDYVPFGEELFTTNRTAALGYTADTLAQKFTGKERDAETGLDFFGARYFSGAQGRFTNPDPKQFPHDVTDPQSWKKYSYTRNNPLRYTDQDGEDWGLPSWSDVNQYASNVVETGGGFVRGAAASITYGLVGAPQPGDSELSRLGQSLGTAAVATEGARLTVQGGAEAGAGLLLAPETGGLSLATAGEGAAKAVVGGVFITGAAKNAQALNAPIESRRAGDFSSSTREEAINQNAQANGGTNKCENCGQDLVRVKAEKGQTPPGNQLQVHHDPPINQGGGKNSTPKVLCRDCHEDIHNP